MKTVYCLVLLLAWTLIPEDVNGWFFRRVRLSFVRKLRVNPYHKIGCIIACKWPNSWACKVCKRKRGLDADVDADKEEPQVEDQIFADLDENQDGFVELQEVAKVTGMKPTNVILVANFQTADVNGDGKLTIAEFKHFHFKNRKELMKALEDDDDADDAAEAADAADADDVANTA